MTTPVVSYVPRGAGSCMSTRKKRKCYWIEYSYGLIETWIMQYKRMKQVVTLVPIVFMDINLKTPGIATTFK